jgi:hypothetical protein
MGNHKYIESPEKMWQLFNDYRAKVKETPFIVKDWVGAKAIEVEREKEKPLTIEGFENYVFDLGIIGDLGHYFSNLNNKYSDFLAICSRIRKTIREDQIAGGMAGIYNPSITQRLNGLVEKVQEDGTHKLIIEYRDETNNTPETTPGTATDSL